MIELKGSLQFLVQPPCEWRDLDPFKRICLKENSLDHRASLSLPLSSLCKGTKSPLVPIWGAKRGLVWVLLPIEAPHSAVMSEIFRSPTAGMLRLGHRVRRESLKKPIETLELLGRKCPLWTSLLAIREINTHRKPFSLSVNFMLTSVYLKIHCGCLRILVCGHMYVCVYCM